MTKTYLFGFAINGTVEDCKDLGIDTLTPAEIAKLEGIK